MPITKRIYPVDELYTLRTLQVKSITYYIDMVSRNLYQEIWTDYMIQLVVKWSKFVTICLHFVLRSNLRVNIMYAIISSEKESIGFLSRSCECKMLTNLIFSTF